MLKWDNSCRFGILPSMDVFKSNYSLLQRVRHNLITKIQVSIEAIRQVSHVLMLGFDVETKDSPEAQSVIVFWEKQVPTGDIFPTTRDDRSRKKRITKDKSLIVQETILFMIVLHYLSSSSPLLFTIRRSEQPNATQEVSKYKCSSSVWDDKLQTNQLVVARPPRTLCPSAVFPR